MKKINPGCSKMRKMFFTIVLLICSAFTLYAGDVDDIKNVIVQCWKAAAADKWDQFFSYYTEDYNVVRSDGTVFCSLKQFKELISVNDGTHPYEFLIWQYKAINGKEPTSEEKNQLKILSQDPEFQVKYKQECKLFMENAHNGALSEAYTIKFRNVEVNGTDAVAVYDAITVIFDNVIPTITVCKLRKINGVWKIYERIPKPM